MYLIIINIILGALAATAFDLTDVASTIWAVVWGVLIFLAGQLLSGYLVQKKVKVEMEVVQEILNSGKNHLQQKVSQWQMKPPGSIKDAQKIIEKEQKVFIDRALKASSGLEKFNRWAPLMSKQINALRLQLHWMNKDFKAVDKLMPHVFVLEPMMACIKISRMYMRNEEGIDKIFKKHSAKVRDENGVLIYALYSWILVQQKKIDEAHKILIDGCEKTDSELLKRNRENLANNRVGHFSNAPFGEEWYALNLEQPKMKMQRQQRFNNRPF
ncbi:MAG: hypothetical protein PF904_21440 [Kiritimatiellae bacterium]|jgi:hypothetical protein|nr:hypothetical protein [Kiritimatiellia bacterium]